MKRFLEDEAELGSDHEDNDHRRKRINSQDSEEDEEGHDKDLEDFVVHGEKDMGPDEAVERKFMDDMMAQDRA